MYICHVTWTLTIIKFSGIWDAASYYEAKLWGDCPECISDQFSKLLLSNLTQEESDIRLKVLLSPEPLQLNDGALESMLQLWTEHYILLQKAENRLFEEFLFICRSRKVSAETELICFSLLLLLAFIVCHIVSVRFVRFSFKLMSQMEEHVKRLDVRSAALKVECEKTGTHNTTFSIIWSL